MKLTEKQRRLRSLARDYGRSAVVLVSRGMSSAAAHDASSAAHKAFLAHPELREDKA